MRKILNSLPIILFPYVYMICFAVYIGIGNSSINVPKNIDNFINCYGIFLILGIILISNILALVMAIINTVRVTKGKTNLKDAALNNILIKLLQIPAFIINFILGMFSMVLSVWGIGLLLWVVIVDLITIIYSGINAIGLSISCYKNKVFSKTVSVIIAILNFLYCIDVVVAIVVFIKTRSKKTNLVDL